ncbi:Aspartate/glutamate/uridylate kinase [Sporodiniella umbellata]|nr:Aspartate/glutamate/uridylate kinase [Sporodiniella umbellata]
MNKRKKKEKMIVAVKLGGAAITNKKSVCEYSSNLDTLLDQVQIAYQYLKAQGHLLVIVHGAGSFGHPQVKRYRLKDGWTSSPNAEQLQGLSHTRATLQQLNTLLITRLEQRGLPVLNLSPVDYVFNLNFDSLMHRVRQYLDLGYVPVLHGDVVLDDRTGCTVLSGDLLLYQLSHSFPIARCVFVTDVEGVYKSDPKIQKKPGSSEIIPIVSVKTQIAECSTEADVTGGMFGKITWAKRIVKECKTDVVLCRWGTTEALDMMSLKDTFTNKMTRFALF